MKKIIAIILALLSVLFVLRLGCSRGTDPAQAKNDAGQVKLQIEETLTAKPELESSLKLPPPEGEEGKNTLAGIDSNHDGVRDDIERYIKVKHRDNPKMRIYLSNQAKISQKMLAVVDDKVKSNKQTNELLTLMACWDKILGNGASIDVWKQEGTAIRTLIKDTPSRAEAWRKADTNYRGEAFAGFWSDESNVYCGHFK